MIEANRDSEKEEIKKKILVLIDSLHKQLRESFNNISESLIVIEELNNYFKKFEAQIKNSRHICLIVIPRFLSAHLMDYKGIRTIYNEINEELLQLIKNYNAHTFHRRSSLFLEKEKALEEIQASHEKLPKNSP